MGTLSPSDSDKGSLVIRAMTMTMTMTMTKNRTRTMKGDGDGKEHRKLLRIRYTTVPISDCNFVFVGNMALLFLVLFCIFVSYR